jgi:hypothetical protein
LCWRFSVIDSKFDACSERDAGRTAGNLRGWANRRQAGQTRRLLTLRCSQKLLSLSRNVRLPATQRQRGEVVRLKAKRGVITRTAGVVSHDAPIVGGASVGFR